MKYNTHNKDLYLMGYDLDFESILRKMQCTRAHILAGHITRFDQLLSNHLDEDVKLTAREMAIIFGKTETEIIEQIKKPLALDYSSGLLWASALGMDIDTVFDLALSQYNQEEAKLREKHKAAFRAEAKALKHAYHGSK